MMKLSSLPELSVQMRSIWESDRAVAVRPLGAVTSGLRVAARMVFEYWESPHVAL